MTNPTLLHSIKLRHSPVFGKKIRPNAIRFMLGCALSIFVATLGGTQQPWHHELPFSALFPSFTHLEKHEGSFLVGNHQQLLHVEPNGRIVGIHDKSAPGQFTVWSTLKKGSISDKTSIVLLRRQYANNKYFVANHLPDSGITHEVSFSDSLLNILQTSTPVGVDMGDNSIWVFGGKFLRKIGFTNDGVPVVLWSQTTSFSPTCAEKTNFGVVACGFSGEIRAFDIDGNLLWAKSVPFKPLAIIAENDGFTINAVSGDAQPTLLRLSINGELVWSKVLPGQNLYGLTSTLDGGFALAGQSDDGQVFAVKTDWNGNLAWTKKYGNGMGNAIVGGADGSNVILYQNGSKQLFLMKTDAFGETTGSKKAQIRERTLQTSDLEITQGPNSVLFDHNGVSTLTFLGGDQVSPIAAHAIWVAGFDPGLNLRATFSYPGREDFQPGILYSPSEDLNRVWHISRNDIARLKADFAYNGQLDEEPAYDLLTWPAKGNPFFPTQNLDFSQVTINLDSLPAPFVDFNCDGVYNVYDGDYPLLKGDRMLWWAMADGPIPPNPNFSLRLDCQFTLFAFDCPTDELGANTLFFEVEIRNRSEYRLLDTHIGHFTDFDIGCPEDDLIGSIPSLNTYYAYNQGAFDGTPGTSCSISPIPIQTVTLLNDTMDHALYILRTGQGSANQRLPETPFEALHYLQGKWRDGTPLTFGSSGYSNPTTNPPTPFAFPSNPNDPEGWSLCSTNLPAVERNPIASHKVGQLLPGAIAHSMVAFTFHPDIPHPCPDTDTWLKPSIQQLQLWHNIGALDEQLDLGGLRYLTPGQSLWLDADLPGADSYQWSNGATSPSISITEPGLYSVTLTRANGCETNDQVLVKNTTGAKEPAVPEWQLYPNPANDLLQIVLEQHNKPVNVLLRNTLGQVAATHIGTGTPVRISVAALPAGLYWAELWQNGQFSGSKKVLIAR